jgi:hypothetical protein
MDIVSHFPRGLDSDTHATVEHLISSIQEAIAAKGFDAFVDALLDPERVGQVLSNAGRINLFPSEQLGPCAPVLVVVARGASGRAGFNAATRHVRQHLVKCPITRAVIFVTDTFAKFGAEHAADWAGHAARGVTFRAFLGGKGLRGATEIALDLVPPAPRARA